MVAGQGQSAVYFQLCIDRYTWSKDGAEVEILLEAG